MERNQNLRIRNPGFQRHTHKGVAKGGTREVSLTHSFVSLYLVGRDLGYALGIPFPTLPPSFKVLTYVWGGRGGL